MRPKIIKPPSFLDRLKAIPHDTRQAFTELDTANDFIAVYNKNNNTNYYCEKNRRSIAPDINIFNKSNNNLVFRLELIEINIETIRKRSGIQDKWIEEIRNGLQNGLDETNLKKGYKITIFINREPTIRLLNTLKKLTLELFSKLLLSDDFKIEKKNPTEGVDYIRLEEWDERKIVGVFPNISLYAYYSEDEYENFYKLIDKALKAKDSKQIYKKCVLVYIPKFDSGIYFEENTFLKASKLIDLGAYKYIDNAYIMAYSFSGGEGHCYYFDVSKDELLH